MAAEDKGWLLVAGSAWLPGDVVDDVEADEGGEGEGDDDRGGVYVEGEFAVVDGGFHGNSCAGGLDCGGDWAQKHETHAAEKLCVGV